jgi:quercetin dioxygenase-like cupin family protein
MPKPLIIEKPGELAVQAVVGESVRTLADGAATGSFEVFLQSGDEGIGPPPHSHPWDEAYYVLGGRLQIMCDGVERVLPPGAFAFLPAGSIHAYKGVGGSTTFLSITSKAGASRFFAEMSREAPEFPPVLEKIAPIAIRNQIIPAMPEAR